MDLKAVASLLMQILKHAAGMYMLVRARSREIEKVEAGSHVATTVLVWFRFKTQERLDNVHSTREIHAINR